jgi:hypothetical protein
MIRRDHADGNDVVRVGDHRPAGHGDHWIKITCCQRIGEVAQIVGEEGVYQGKVGGERRLDKEGLAIQLDLSFALLGQGAKSGRSEDTAEAVTAPGRLATRAASLIPEFDELLDKAKEKAPARSLVSIDDVGVATAFLAHDAALITGETLYVDGGYHIID